MGVPKCSFYRWFREGDAGGFTGGLRYVVGPAAYAEMLADGLTPETASNTQVENYADHCFEYDSNRSVTKEVATDCAGCGGGSGTGNSGETFVRSESSHADGYNSWKWKVVLTKANGNVVTSFTNYLGQVMIKELKENASSTRKWITYTQYGQGSHDAGKTIKVASPAAVIGYSDASANLAVSLRTDAGLVTYRNYYQSTNLANGAAAGYLESVEIREGDGASGRIKQQEIQYTESGNTSGEKTYTPSKTIRYRDDAGNEPQETNLDYLWYGNGSMQQRTTTLPVVPANQNGDGASVTTKEYYNSEGWMTFRQDERGIVTKYTHDPSTGLQTQVQVDVDQSEAGMPAGWTVGGSSPHLNVTTNTEYDDLGRVTQTLGPAHEADIGSAQQVRHATWMVYQEAVSSNQAWTGTGYQQVSGGAETLVDPVRISFTDKNNRPIDQIQSKRSTGSGKLSASDTFLRSDWTRWSVSIYSTVGLIEYSRVYHTIPPQTPDQGLTGVTSDPGVVNANYEETNYGTERWGQPRSYF